jgi:exosome complex component RRP4
VVDRKEVIPGDVIAKGDYRYGSYIEKRGDEYVALRVGTAELGRDGIRLSPASGPYLPRVDDQVIGKVVDMNGFGWEIDINACFFGYLPASFVFGREFSPATNDLASKFRVGDIIACKVESFDRSRDPQISIRGPGYGLVPGGEIVKISPLKVPRLIGKRGAMINMISGATNTDIKAGQNGVVVVAGEPQNVAKAVEAVKMIQNEANTPELAKKVQDLLGVVETGGQA